jgi:HEAT repeat protein
MSGSKQMGRPRPSKPDRPDSYDWRNHLDDLAARDFRVRQRAREALVRSGKRAVPDLIRQVEEGPFQARWEAAQALGEIGDPAAAPALVRALRDEEQDVRWVAADALIALGRPSVPALLQALIEHAESLELRQGAHHVLRNLEEESLRRQLAPVTEILTRIGADLDVIPVAQQVLETLSRSS